jgi:branched-chain amino acid transport system substrate-binding protein
VRLILIFNVKLKIIRPAYLGMAWEEEMNGTLAFIGRFPTSRAHQIAVHKRFFLVALTAVATLGFIATKANPAERIQIGVNEPLTGPVAVSGNYVVNGAKIAADEINGKGGVLGSHVELLIRDNKSNPTEAVNVAEQLIVRDKVPVLMGAWSSTYTLAVMPKLMEYQIPMVVETSSSPKITVAGNPWVFRISPTADMQAAAFGKVVGNFKIKKAAFLVVNNEWGLGNLKAFTEVLKSHGIETIAQETMDPTAQDMSAQLAKLKNSGADALLLVTEVQQLVLILKQSQSLRIPQKLIVASASSSPDQIIEEAGNAANNVAVAVAFAPWFPELSTNPKVAEAFVAEWKKRGYPLPGLTEGFRGYDGIKTIAAAIKDAGKAEPAAIRDALWKTRLEGVTDNIYFEKQGPAGKESGQAPASVFIVHIKDGKIVKE